MFFFKLTMTNLQMLLFFLNKIRVIDLLLYFIASIFSRKKYFKIAKYIFLNNIIISMYYNIITIKNIMSGACDSVKRT